MKKFPVFQRITLFLTAVLYCSLPQTVFCGEQVFSDQNCAFFAPEGWTDTTKDITLPGVVRVYSKPDGTAVIVLMVQKGGHPAPIGDNYAEEFEKGANKGGNAKLISGSFMEIQGVKAYRRLGEIIANGNSGSNLSLSIPTKDTFYCLSGTSNAGDATQDPDIQKAFASFRFLAKPEPAETAAYWQGYMIGQVFFVILVGWIIFKIVRSRREEKKREKLPSNPPPTSS